MHMHQRPIALNGIVWKEYSEATSERLCLVSDKQISNLSTDQLPFCNQQTGSELNSLVGVKASLVRGTEYNFM